MPLNGFTKASTGELYFPRDPTLCAVFYRTTQVYGALLICWFCVGGLITLCIEV